MAESDLGVSALNEQQQHPRCDWCLDSPSLHRQQEAMMGFAESAYPICRSITGEGVRETFGLLQDGLLSDVADSFEVREVRSDTPVLDWTVPKEWNVREAWIKGPDGVKVVDFADHNLHLMGYSIPVHERLSLTQLEQHLHSLPEQPELIPYRTSYYAERWGFCLPHRVRDSLGDGEYEVFIDSELTSGSLSYGEIFLPGTSRHEVLFSTHSCHPSLANDNLSGLSVLASLASILGRREATERRYGYRFLFVPGTIGAITWLAQNPAAVQRVQHGLVVSNLGDPGSFHYKRSRGGSLASSDSGWPIDAAVEQAAADLGVEIELQDFVPFGYDERQYCSPGFNLPVGSLSRTPWGRYPEYHTSADDLDLLDGHRLGESLQLLLALCCRLEETNLYRSVKPDAEPQLGRRGLYRTLGGDDRGRERELAMLWVLNLSDGRWSSQQIAHRSGIDSELIKEATTALLAAELLERV